MARDSKVSSMGLLFPTCIVDPPTRSNLTAVPSNKTVLQGSTVSLNCSTDANPGAHVYQFYFQDTLIDNSSLVVFNVTVDADGVYTCVPINTVGEGDNATLMVTTVGKLIIRTLINIPELI